MLILMLEPPLLSKLNHLFYAVITADPSFRVCAEQALHLISFLKTDPDASKLLAACHQGNLFRPSCARVSTSFYLSFKHLQGLEPLLRHFGDHEEILDSMNNLTAEIRHLLQKDDFWTNLQALTQVLEPLALACHIQQGPCLRLDDVLLSLGHLQRVYKVLANGSTWLSPTPRVRRACSVVREQLEGLWNGAEQTYLVASVLLNPFLGATELGLITITEDHGLHLMELIFKRQFKVNPSFTFPKQWASYWHSTGTYSRSSLKVDDITVQATSSVCPNQFRGH